VSTPRDPETGGGPRSRRLPVWPVAFAVYLFHALLFGGWIVDDAGISFVYARNLAQGHGLVSQPGLAPVEGYSNFLWVLLLTPPLLLHLFHPVWTPKLLSLGLAAGTFFLLDRSLTRLSGGSRGLSWMTLLLLAVCTPFVIWTVSGLENPLTVFLAVALFWILVTERREEAPLPSSAGRWALLAGAVAAGLAMTRPDGVVYAALYPLLTPRWGRQSVLTSLRSGAGRAALSIGVFALLFGAFLGFRVLYFGDLYPNTYYAKGSPSPVALLPLLTFQPPAVAKLFTLMYGFAGTWGGLLLVALGAATAFLAGRRRFHWGHAALLAFSGLAVFVYIVLPHDWMPEYRFATPLFPFFYSYVVLLAASLGGELFAEPSRRHLAALAGGILAVGLSLVSFASRSVLFAAAPTVPFAETVEDYGLRYNRYADLLGVREGSLLVPDVGGTLWASRLRIYDLGALCDRTIARTRGVDQQAFYDYVFAQARPTFIHSHNYWTVVSALELDPRFRRDYVPIFEYDEPHGRQRLGHDYHSGDWVRREVAQGREAELLAIGADLEEQYRRRLASRAREASAPDGPLDPLSPP